MTVKSDIDPDASEQQSHPRDDARDVEPVLHVALVSQRQVVVHVLGRGQDEWHKDDRTEAQNGPRNDLNCKAHEMNPPSTKAREDRRDKLIIAYLLLYFNVLQ
ncbi:MAG: hypothetical protein JWM52_702 [Candidatus Saccharibacteria bacterium]|nr:hypothetical protein [Candidatus Saccharibacteria bacterium]